MSNLLTPTEQRAIVGVFAALADAVDGGDALPDDVRTAYAEAFPYLSGIYGRLIDVCGMVALLPDVTKGRRARQ